MAGYHKMMSEKARRRNLAAVWLCSLLVLSADATVLVYLSNSTGSGQLAHRFDDVPATDGFGPRIPDTGFGGRLQVASPDIFACSKLDPPVLPEHETAEADRNLLQKGLRNGRRSSQAHHNTEVAAAGFQLPADQHYRTTTATAVTSADGLPLAVLISRSVESNSSPCTFEQKVLQAQAAGYSLAIVYDYKQEGLFKMGASTDGSTQQPPVEIPSVLVNQKSGLALKALIAASPDPRGPELFVDNMDPFVNMFVTVNFTMLMVVFGFMLALLTCGSMMILTLHRYRRRYEELLSGGATRLMPLPEVMRLPEVLVEEDSKLVGEACPVCLETYRAGDKLRGLPCLHAFHVGCITPWLTQGQRTCPMCKDPVRIEPTRANSSNNSSRSGLSASDSAANTTSAETPGFQPSRPRESQRSSTPNSYMSGNYVVGSGGLGVAYYTGLNSRGREEDGRGNNHATASVRSAGGRATAEGDRLPLLSNSRGAHSDGGSMGESSPV